jgi:4-amino-4-deoxy-L-arabinose transferase-like glycosyltransferase
LIAAGLVALEPVSVLLCNQLLTETLFTLELVTGLWLLTRYWRAEKVRYLIASAVVLAATALTRPIAQFLPLALLPLFAITAKQKRLRAVLTTGLLFVLVSGMLISAWAYRNHRTSGVFTLSTIADTNLLYYRARAVLAEAENTSTRAAMLKLRAEMDAATAQHNLTPAEKIAHQRRLALKVFRQYPVLTGTMLAKGAARLLLDPGYSIVCTLLDLESTDFECIPGGETMLASNSLEKAVDRFGAMTIVQQLVLLWSLFLLGLIYLGTAVGVSRLVHKRNWTTLAILATVILYFVILSVGGETTYRFRAPIVPFIAVLASAGYAMLITRHRGRAIKER